MLTMTTKTKYPIHDLVLFHGGERGYGIVDLDHRATGKGEGLEHIQTLRNTPAIWASTDREESSTYAFASRTNRKYRGGRENLLYYIDLPQVTVATISTYNKTPQEIDSEVHDVLNETDRPDVLLIKRQSSNEYVIPQHTQPAIVRVEKHVSASQLRPWQDIPCFTLDGTDARCATPSETFCQVMQHHYNEEVLDFEYAMSTSRPGKEAYNDYQKGLKNAQHELTYWQSRCANAQQSEFARQNAIQETEQRIAALQKEIQYELGRIDIESELAQEKQDEKSQKALATSQARYETKQHRLQIEQDRLAYWQNLPIKNRATIERDNTSPDNTPVGADITHGSAFPPLSAQAEDIDYDTKPTPYINYEGIPPLPSLTVKKTAYNEGGSPVNPVTSLVNPIAKNSRKRANDKVKTPKPTKPTGGRRWSPGGKRR